MRGNASLTKESIIVALILPPKYVVRVYVYALLHAHVNVHANVHATYIKGHDSWGIVRF